MGLLRPKGIEATIGGERVQLLFTLRGIEEIEEHYDEPIAKVMQRFNDERQVISVTGYIATVLMNDYLYWLDKDGEQYSVDDVMSVIPYGDAAQLIAKIIQAYTGSFPEQEEEDPNPRRRRRKSTSPVSSTSAPKDSDSASEKSPE